ncbi:hypothetical protein ABTY20_09460 [Streptomyces sp. NPDC126497]|uniref:hypothetical protein n=1 Tax=Streptomyces sp. NPDC126497 TaxID=3155313 RepID=UPI00333055F8
MEASAGPERLATAGELTTAQARGLDRALDRLRAWRIASALDMAGGPDVLVGYSIMLEMWLLTNPTSRVNGYLCEEVFRGVALGRNRFGLLGLKDRAPAICTARPATGRGSPAARSAPWR